MKPSLTAAPAFPAPPPDAAAAAGPEQGEFALPPAPQPVRSGDLRALDLFAGIGGLSAGFAQEGFIVTGVDAERVAGAVYAGAGFGMARQQDLGTDPFHAESPVVIGGPPCRPWSAVNVQRRRASHPDHGLLAGFLDHVRAIRPEVFVMENVPPLMSDADYIEGIRRLREHYDVQAHVLHYDRFGAATRRRRLFTVGVRGAGRGAHHFFQLLAAEQAPARTVGDVIRHLRDCPRGGRPDHDWSELRSIGKYRDWYADNRFGWRQLDYDAPAPSFGSVAKTYILHPEAGRDGFPERVVSVREVLAITGFDERVRFPDGTPRALRYQMAANAVSPQVSRAVAAAVRRLLSGAVKHAPADSQLR